jgi:ectoine hydroxylase-related dioxygenase (phytanoyl-CoA dioxygenase family)
VIVVGSTSGNAKVNESFHGCRLVPGGSTARDVTVRPVIDLGGHHPLDDATVESFRARGHAVVRGLASAEELAELAPEIVEQGTSRAWDKRPLEERDTYGKAFLQSFNLYRTEARIRTFVFAPRFAEVAARLLGVDGVRLYHDQGLFKEPGGGPTPWHQDGFYWPLDPDRMVTMWMPLVDIPPEIGTMTFASGSHLLTDLRGTRISDESHAFFESELRDRGLELETHGPLAAGDATFHAGWIVHSAPGNPTDRMRPVMTVIYVDAAARVADEITRGQKLDHEVWLGGLPPGAPLDDERNPVLWPAR